MHNREYLKKLLQEKNELVEMIELLLEDGYRLSNNSNDMELILYLLLTNGSVRLFKEKKFLFWKSKKAIVISDNN